jgi:hypothetical protein
MKVQLTIFIAIFFYVQSCMSQEREESEEKRCARTISSMSAIMGQLKNNPSVRGEQIAAVIDGHTSDPALRVFIRTEIAPRIFSQDKKSAEIYMSSKIVKDRCVQALNTYLGPYGK